MTYEELLTVSDGLGLNTKEKDLQAFDGRIKGNRIAIRRSIPTSAEKACVLAEELGHYFTSTGDIMDDSVESQKQELKARQWAYDVQIGLSGLVEAKEAGCRNQFETAEYLGVSLPFLVDCLRCYRSKYGIKARLGQYTIAFEPYMNIREDK